MDETEERNKRLTLINFIKNHFGKTLAYCPNEDIIEFYMADVREALNSM